MQDVLARVRAVNSMSNEIRESLLDFTVQQVPIGKVRPKTAKLLCEVGSDVFQLTDETAGGGCLTLSDSVPDSIEGRTEAINRVMARLRDRGIIQGWRDENYPISTSFYDPPMFHMERAAVPWLGCIEYGVHINGLVYNNDNEGNFIKDKTNVQMWMGRRSATKSKYPGMLDHIVAGGQPSGLGLLENVVKECQEEAGIPEDLVRAGVRPAGAISYANHNPKKDTITRAVMFNFDLVLPSTFAPKPVDGEVQEFFLWSVDQILESMAADYADPIKPNCYVVIIDWLMREGHLSPEVPGYLDVLRELRSGDCQ